MGITETAVLSLAIDSTGGRIFLATKLGSGALPAVVVLCLQDLFQNS